jgi:hypothetical protein
MNASGDVERAAVSRKLRTIWLYVVYVCVYLHQNLPVIDLTLIILKGKYIIYPVIPLYWFTITQILLSASVTHFQKNAYS